MLILPAGFFHFPLPKHLRERMNSEFMKKIVDGFAKIVEMFLAFIMVIMVVVVFLATVGRYTNLFAIPWSEECARYCMEAIVYLGLMLASLNDGHFSVDLVPLVFANKPKVIKAFSVIAALLVDAFAALLAYYGWIVCAKMLAQGKLSPMLSLPLGAVYMLIPVGIVLMAVFYTYRTVIKVTEKEEDK